MGYNIIEKNKIKELLSKISRFRHYKNIRNKKIYLKNIKKTIKKTIKRENVPSYFLKFKIREMYQNMDIYSDVLEFINEHCNCLILVSVDNRQYDSFNRIVGFIKRKGVIIKKESELIKGTPEYLLSIVLDNILNIERSKKLEN